MKKTLSAFFAAVLTFLLLFSGCSEGEEVFEETNPESFNYDMLDISLVVDGIYSRADISELTLKSVSRITDETVLTEQFYLDLSNVISYDIRSAEGNFGVADVALIRVKEGTAGEVMESLESRKDDRINEFLHYDVYDSYEIALNADIFESGEMVVMLMLSEDDKAIAHEILNYYLP